MKKATFVGSRDQLSKIQSFWIDHSEISNFYSYSANNMYEKVEFFVDFKNNLSTGNEMHLKVIFKKM
jgi:hypothetical protein